MTIDHEFWHAVVVSVWWGAGYFSVFGIAWLAAEFFRPALLDVTCGCGLTRIEVPREKIERLAARLTRQCPGCALERMHREALSREAADAD